MMRILLAIAIVAVFGLAGCEKKQEPQTLGDQVDAVKAEAEKTAEAAGDTAAAATETAQDAAADATKTAEEAAK